MSTHCFRVSRTPPLFSPPSTPPPPPPEKGLGSARLAALPFRPPYASSHEELPFSPFFLRAAISFLPSVTGPAKDTIFPPRSARPLEVVSACFFLRVFAKSFLRRFFYLICLCNIEQVFSNWPFFSELPTPPKIPTDFFASASRNSVPSLSPQTSDFLPDSHNTF